ncbi:hypothetical protein NQD34_016890 [Periophthalmus magnuspinnatus]|uniref:uncharacterized protein si:dkeyp-38g8.5 n=1 Tax=Periophthalmus magnuspinnatus TaxID=409849 RepID=UPI00145A2FAC|nr:uncharacterized protein si:dkeyp-38g8.5 [Periophthalmus magnuspinnatus]KAJ0012556.1 hypothetical protein NQD34_016890 [Periophthalmus magnuspinnatus]
MECHDYTDPSQGLDESHNEIFPNEIVYKLNPKETQELVKLRISNKSLFNGKRNASMCGWRAILRHMGLQDKMTHYQAAKKWENLKKKYKEIKLTPQGNGRGVAPFPQWSFYTLMSDAMEGRLDGSAPILTTTQQDRNEVLNCPKRKKRRLLMPTISSVESMAPAASSELFTGPEVEVTLNGEVPEEGNLDIGHILQEVENEKKKMDRHKQMMEREHLLLQRERAALDREVASLERDRASLDRDRAAIEREKALLDRERTVVEKEREAVAKDRLALEQEKARLVRTQGDSDNTDCTDRKERFLFLFEKLINNF